MELSQQRRGEYVDMSFMTEKRVSLKYNMPLAEVITDFFDQVKSRSKGYASMEYSLSEYRQNDLVRLDIMINGETAAPLSASPRRQRYSIPGAWKSACWRRYALRPTCVL